MQLRSIPRAPICHAPSLDDAATLVLVPPPAKAIIIVSANVKIMAA